VITQGIGNGGMCLRQTVDFPGLAGRAAVGVDRIVFIVFIEFSGVVRGEAKGNIPEETASR
jgi:hypothetical protein